MDKKKCWDIGHIPDMECDRCVNNVLDTTRSQMDIVSYNRDL